VNNMRIKTSVKYLLQIITAKCTQFIVVMYKTPLCFGPHWPRIREDSCTKQLLRQNVISNIRNCGEIINIMKWRGQCVHSRWSSLQVGVCSP